MSSNTVQYAPASITELVDFIAKSVREQYQKTGRRVDGSFLAHLVRTQYPGIDFARLGITRLGDAVRIAESRKLIRRHPDVLHLEVSPADEPAPMVQPSETSEKQRLYVRPDVWRALVLTTGNVPFFDRIEGKIAEEPAERVHEIERDRRYVRLEEISEGDRLAWAKQFLETRPDVRYTQEDLEHLVRGARNRFDAALNRDWIAYRAAKVIEHIKRWADKNGLPTDQILVAARKDAKQRPAISGERDEAAIRRAVIASIEEMPLAHLEELAIPLRYVIRHFKAK